MDDPVEDERAVAAGTTSARGLPPRGAAADEADYRPDLDAFRQQYAGHGVGRRPLRELHTLLVEIDGEQSWLARLEWLARLSQWVKHRTVVRLAERRRGHEAPRTRRLHLLLRVLRDDPALHWRFRRLLGSVLTETAGYRLFTEAGLPAGSRFLSDAARRLVERVIPRPHDQDLSEMVSSLFRTSRDARWLERLPTSLLLDLAEVLHAGEDPREDLWAPAWAAMREALLLLSARVAALGLDEVIRTRLPAAPITGSPFLRLCHASEQVVDALHASGGHWVGPHPQAALVDEFREVITQCRQAVTAVETHLEEYGTSVNLVFQLEKISGNLDRIEALLSVLAPSEAHLPTQRVVRLLVNLVRDQVNDHRVDALLRRNLHQLARKIVESAGEHGGHYITSSSREWLSLLSSAAGGGFVTAGTTLAKFGLSAVPAPPFFAALLASTNYAGSFLVMQALGFTLATKQPSMTAASLASALNDHPGAHQHDAIVALIARICRSQLAAVVGNVGMVIVTMFGIELLCRYLTGHSILGQKTAAYVVRSLHPWESLTLPLAALTGFFLWAASVGAGWLENFVVYHRLPEAIAQSRRLRHLLGRRMVDRLSSMFSHHHAAGIGGNVTLGVLLGTTPVVGSFFGVPLDVRHITLSTGALTLAVMSLGSFSWQRSDTVAAVGGLLCILVLNFGVSFYLALRVAISARNIDRADTRTLRRALVKRMLRAPWEFLCPPLGRRGSSP